MDKNIFKDQKAWIGYIIGLREPTLTPSTK
jgi:hypothetical protein